MFKVQVKMQYGMEWEVKSVHTSYKAAITAMKHAVITGKALTAKVTDNNGNDLN